MKRLLLNTLLLLVLVPFNTFGQAPCSNLFISEYVEGYGNNKAIEIYNPTNDTIDLSAYSLNSTVTTASPVFLIGQILPHDVYVAVIEKLDPLGVGQDAPVWDSLQAKADGFYCPDYNINGTMYFNGDDAVTLSHNSVIIDIFGKLGEDPGSGWTSIFPFNGPGVNVTQDHSLIRKNNITLGVYNNPSSFNPLFEWDSIPPIYFIGPSFYGNWTSLGSHDCICNICPSDTSISVSSCQTYTLPSGLVAFQSGIYTDTIPNYFGCDSIIETNFTYTPVLVNLPITTCDMPYVSPSGNNYSSAGQYEDTLFTLTCDTIFLLDLNFLPASSNTINITSCGPYALNGSVYTTTGTYAQTLTNYLGCDSTLTINLVVNSTTFNPSFTVNNQLFTSPPFAAQFTNTTPNPSNYNFTWDFSDGTILQSNNTSVFHEYLYNGLYDVTLIAEDIVTGCTDTIFYDDFVFCTGGTSCTHAAVIDQVGPVSACLSDSVYLTCNTHPNFTYQWRLNGAYIPGAVDTIYYPLQTGNYSVLILENGCPEVSPDLSVVIGSSPQVPIITSSGNITPCLGGNVTLSVPGIYNSYLWSTGGTSMSEVVSTSGSYFVTVTNNAGCEAISPIFSINASFASPPEICITGVDSLTNFNRVVWEKPLSTAIDSFYVYKETNQANIYQKIGGTAYVDTAVFVDISSNPSVQAYRYKLSLLDSCGIESALGSMHKTIHLTINQGVGQTWNLIWSHYEGFTFPSYNIYRGTTPGNLTLLTTIASNLSSYTDLTPPGGVVYYQIEIVNPNPCDPTLKMLNYNDSRSNIVTSGAAGIQNLLNNGGISIYPNPTKGVLIIEANLIKTPFDITILDAQGKIIMSERCDSDLKEMNISSLKTGIYFVKINNDSINRTVRIVKQ
jgi:hypothetical protein